MEILDVIRHVGVSFSEGADLVFVRARHADESSLMRRWQHWIVEPGLGSELEVEAREEDGVVLLRASTPPILPDRLVREILGWEGDDDQAPFRDDLRIHRADLNAWRRSVGLYDAIARHRGWPAVPAVLGGYPCLFLGTGRYCRLRTINVHQDVSAVLALANRNKAYGRDLLRAHDIPVPPGEVAHSADRAVEAARELGYPVVLKRLHEANSAGVILGIENDAECEAAAARFLETDALVLVEKMVPGIELRLHFVDGKLWEAFAAGSLEVLADGVRSLDALIEDHAPAYHGMLGASDYHRRRVVLQLWQHGVRSFEDLGRIVPEAGQVIRASAATNERMESVEASEIHPEDLARLEAVLGEYGAPSAGVDVILPRRGARFADGGVVLEVNVPCGSHYLGSAARAADQEMLSMARRVPGFVAESGRVPLWIATEQDFPRGSTERAELEAWFEEGGPDARIDTLTEERDWLPILTNRSAGSLLVWVDEAAISRHGMPHDLAPRVLHVGSSEDFEREFPRLTATARHAGGELAAWSTESLVAGAA